MAAVFVKGSSLQVMSFLALDAMLTRYILWFVSLSVCPSVTSQCPIKTAKRGIRQNRIANLVFWRQRSWRKFQWLLTSLQRWRQVLAE